MHIITASKPFNYNSSASALIKLEISYNVSSVLQTLYTYQIPNATQSVEDLLDALADNFFTLRAKDLTVDYLNYETTRLLSNDDTITFNSFKLYVNSVNSDSYYLMLDFGVREVLPSGTVSTTISADPDGYITFPYWGRWRFPLQSNSKVTARPNLVSQPSSWEDLEVKSENETEITKEGVFNSFNRRFHFKKVGITNLSWFNVQYADNFLNYISEGDPTLVITQINSNLALLLFGDTTYTTVSINSSESGYDSITYEYENLCKYNVTMIPSIYFTRLV